MRRILVYAVRIIKGRACTKKNKRKEKKSEIKRSKMRREKDEMGEGGRFKVDQYFIFERRCHDGNRYMKIEKHDTTSHFELKSARWV